MALRNLPSAQRIAILVEPGTRAAVLDAAARLPREPAPHASRRTLTRVVGDSLRKREPLASTAIGYGGAIAYARLAGIARRPGRHFCRSHLPRRRLIGRDGHAASA